MLETIKIVAPEVEGLGYQIINKSDFDPKVHKEYTEEPKGEKTLDQMTTKKAIVEFAAKALPEFKVPEGTVAEMKAAVQAELDKTPKE